MRLERETEPATTATALPEPGVAYARGGAHCEGCGRRCVLLWHVLLSAPGRPAIVQWCHRCTADAVARRERRA